MTGNKTHKLKSRSQSHITEHIGRKAQLKHIKIYIHKKNRREQNENIIVQKIQIIFEYLSPVELDFMKRKEFSSFI